MILVAIICVAIIQVVGYCIFDNHQLPKLKAILVIAILLGHFFIFPKMFFPQLPPGPACGMPVFGVMLAFWILGSLATIVTHSSYVVIARLVKSRADRN